MSIDPRTFRQTVGQFVTGVTVIAMEVDGSIRALTANSFTSLSLNPPLVLFCLGKGTKAGQLIQDVVEFSVNILSQEQQALSSVLCWCLEGRGAAAVFVHSRGRWPATRWRCRGARLRSQRGPRRRRSLDRRRAGGVDSSQRAAARTAGFLRRALLRACRRRETRLKKLACSSPGLNPGNNVKGQTLHM